VQRCVVERLAAGNVGSWQYDYAPGTPQRAGLEAALKKMQAELPFEVPCVINGKEVSCSFWLIPPSQPCSPPSPCSECPKNVVPTVVDDFWPHELASGQR